MRRNPNTGFLSCQIASVWAGAAPPREGQRQLTPTGDVAAWPALILPDDGSAPAHFFLLHAPDRVSEPIVVAEQAESQGFEGLAPGPTAAADELSHAKPGRCRSDIKLSSNCYNAALRPLS